MMPPISAGGFAMTITVYYGELDRQNRLLIFSGTAAYC